MASPSSGMPDVGDASQAMAEPNEPRHDALESTPPLHGRHPSQDTGQRHLLHPVERVAPRHQVSVGLVDDAMECEASPFGLVADDVAHGDSRRLEADDADHVTVSHGGSHAGAAGAEAYAAGPLERQTNEIGAASDGGQGRRSSKLSAAIGSRSLPRKTLAHHVPERPPDMIQEPPPTGTRNSDGSGSSGSTSGNI